MPGVLIWNPDRSQTWEYFDSFSRVSSFPRKGEWMTNTRTFSNTGSVEQFGQTERCAYTQIFGYRLRAFVRTGVETGMFQEVFANLV